MNTAKTITYETKLKDFQSIVLFLTLRSIKDHFKTLDAYAKAPNSSKAYHLNIRWPIIRKLVRVDNNLYFAKFRDASKHLFTYHHHCHKNFKKSNKSFARNSWFEIPLEKLNELFADESNFSTKTTKLLTKAQHKWIDKHVYNYIDKEEKKTDKTEPEKSEPDKTEPDKTETEKSDMEEAHYLEVRASMPIPPDISISKFLALDEGDEPLNDNYFKKLANIRHACEEYQQEKKREREAMKTMTTEKQNSEPKASANDIVVIPHPENDIPDDIPATIPSQPAQGEPPAHPADDIPVVDDLSLERKQAILQDKVNNYWISPREAADIYKRITGLDHTFKEARCGFSIEDAVHHKPERAEMIDRLVAKYPGKWTTKEIRWFKHEH